MKKIYSTIFSILLFSSCFAQQVYQYFDGADTVYSNSVNIILDTNSNNIWQIGIPHKIIFDSAATFPNALITDSINNYPVNDSSQFGIEIFQQFGGMGIFALRWKQKLDFDSKHDGGIVEFKMDTNSSWQNIFNNPFVYNLYGFQTANQDTLVSGEFAFSGTDSTWRDIWLCFDVSWMQQFPDTISLRFRIKTDSIDNGKEGWVIDNFIGHQTYIHTIKKEEKTQYLTVFPNPTNGIVHIETEKILEYHIIEKMELFNTKGQVVEQWNNIPTKFWFDTNKYEAGLYFLKVKTNLRTEILPVMVRKN